MEQLQPGATQGVHSQGAQGSFLQSPRGAEITQRSGSIVARLWERESCKTRAATPGPRRRPQMRRISRGHPITIGWLRDGRVYGVLVDVGRREAGRRGWIEEALQEHAQWCPVLWRATRRKWLAARAPVKSDRRLCGGWALLPRR
jgi:hypothetical protein